jgi:hypothetical protein
MTRNTEPIHRSNLRPLPMRITEMQFERLNAVRLRDGLGIQEHVRRALDIYLAGMESQASISPAEPPTGVTQPARRKVIQK